ncbi:histidine--tRNA ligase [soil metagenome]
MSRAALPGFRDFYPQELAERAYVMDAWHEVARRYGFVEYDGPPLEPLELYTAKSGEEIVGQLYVFEDKGGRKVALRPEMTPTFARMVGARLNALRKPVRWYSTPQLFRYERQQKGRLREHFQLNVDIVGETDVAADAELLALAIDVMREVGLTSSDVRARVSDRRLLTALLAHFEIPGKDQPLVYAVLDKLDREPRAELEQRLTDAGLSPRTVGSLFEAVAMKDVADLRVRLGGVRAMDAQFDDLERYLELLGALGVRDWVQLDLSVVRGLAYYTGIVFELFDTAGEFRAICGGGRYDDLLATLGGTAAPALGFGMGDVVLGELLRSRKLMPALEPAVDFWVASDDDALLPEVMSVAARLRAAGHSVEYSLKSQQLARQLKAATSAGAAQVVILLLDQWNGGAGTMTVKTLADGSERVVRGDELFNSQV